MNRAALMQRIEQHFDAKCDKHPVGVAQLLEDISWQVYQWARADALAELHPEWLAEKERAERAEQALAQAAPVADRGDLLPCPFCGGEAAMQEHEPHSHSSMLKSIIPSLPDHPGSFTIECVKAGCNTGQIADTRAEVVAMWNRRAAGHQAAAPDIKALVDRFLGWKLPEDFYPDCYITFDRKGASGHPLSWPIGTNLLTAEQAKEMFLHCLGEGAK